MKKQLIFLICIILTQTLKSQVLGQDKKGFSTIVQPSASFNLDVTNNVATLDFYQVYHYPFFNKKKGIRSYKTEAECYVIYGAKKDSLLECIKVGWKESQHFFSSAENERFLIGLDLKGSSSNGIALIINDEKVLSAAQVSLTIGHQWTRKRYNFKKASTFVDNYIADLSPEHTTQEEILIREIENRIDILLIKKIVDPKFKKNLVYFKSVKDDKINNLKITEKLLLKKTDSIFKTAKINLNNKTYVEALINAYEDYILYLEKQPNTDTYIQIVRNSMHYNRHLIYGKVGLTGSSFKRDRGDSLSAIGERFKDQNNQGYRIDIGYTGQFKNYNYLGLNLGLSRTTNATNLIAITYKIQTTDTSIIPNLITNSEFKALSGPFDRFLQYEFNMDYARLVPLINHTSTLADTVNKNRNRSVLLSVNPYLRHTFYEFSETLKPNTSLGLGLYAFNTSNGSIAGGLFLQADDVFNVNKSVAINFTKQITFGIVFKAAIKSFNPIIKN